MFISVRVGDVRQLCVRRSGRIRTHRLRHFFGDDRGEGRIVGDEIGKGVDQILRVFRRRVLQEEIDRVGKLRVVGGEGGEKGVGVGSVAIF